MKKIIFIFLTVITCVNLANAQDNWFLQNPYPTNKILNHVKFSNNAYGLIVGEGGTILKSVDEGNTWIKLNCEGAVNINCVEIIGSNIILIGCSNGVFKSSDGGNNWTHVFPFLFSVASVKFLNQNEGYCVAYQGNMWKTSNGGNNWIQINTGTTNDILSLSVINNQNMFISGTNGMILKTSNSGSSWITQNSGDNGNITCISFLNKDTGFANISGFPAKIIKTLNSGNNWYSVNFNTLGTFTLHFVNNTTGYASCGSASGFVLKTTNSGNNWISSLTGSINGYRSVYFVNNGLGFMVGYNGLIVKTIDSGNIWINLSHIIERSLWDCNFINEKHRIYGRLFWFNMGQTNLS